MRIANDLLTLTDTDLSADLTASGIDCSTCWHAGFQIKIASASSLNGTFNIQATLDEVKEEFQVTNWITIDTQAVSSLSAAAIYLKTYENIPYTFMRVTWIASSGTGTLTEIRATAKGA
jgi:hypothetical protein